MSRFIIVLVLVSVYSQVEARPSAALSRLKRVVSDQRLAELETRLSLNKMKGRLLTVPIAFGKVDPAKIGRKRRSSTETNLQKLRRILRSVVEDDAELSPKDRNRYVRFLLSRWDELQEHEADTNGDQEENDIGYY